MNIHFLDGWALPSAPPPHPHYLGTTITVGVYEHYTAWEELSSHLCPQPPHASDTICHVHTHTHNHTHTSKCAQATPWGSVLRCNFLSIKISFLSCRCHNNAMWWPGSGGKSNEVSRYRCGLPVTPDPQGQWEHGDGGKQGLAVIIPLNLISRMAV